MLGPGDMQIIDFQAVRERAERERRSKLRVVSRSDPDEATVLPLGGRLTRWAAAQVSTFLPEPDPGPSAA